VYPKVLIISYRKLIKPVASYQNQARKSVPKDILPIRQFPSTLPEALALMLCHSFKEECQHKYCQQNLDVSTLVESCPTLFFYFII